MGVEKNAPEMLDFAVAKLKPKLGGFLPIDLQGSSLQRGGGQDQKAQWVFRSFGLWKDVASEERSGQGKGPSKDDVIWGAFCRALHLWCCA